MARPPEPSCSRTSLRAAPAAVRAVLTRLDDGRILFRASNGEVGSELWVTDGTTDGTILLRDINPGTANGLPGLFTPFGNGQVLFVATDSTNGQELWTTDGTPEGTILLRDINPERRGVPSPA